LTQYYPVFLDIQLKTVSALYYLMVRTGKSHRDNSHHPHASSETGTSQRVTTVGLNSKNPQQHEDMGATDEPVMCVG
jgi:hypothetical protein